MPKTNNISTEAPRLRLPAWLRIVLRVLLGLLFVVSAAAKLLDIDPFEMYVFSYGFFPLTVVDVLVRLCIAAELILGLLIALGWFKRLVRLFSLLLLIFFSLFLCYAALRGRMESCQCFGQLLDIDPIQSLLKNAILILWTLFVYQGIPKGSIIDSKPRLIISLVASALITAAIFIVSVPDSWMFGQSGNRYNQQTLAEAISPTGILAPSHLDQDRQLVAFVTPGCPFCQMSRQKISAIADRHDLDTTHIHYIQPDDIGDSIFMRITFGSRPLVVLLDQGNVVATYHYRNISERQVADVLQRK